MTQGSSPTRIKCCRQLCQSYTLTVCAASFGATPQARQSLLSDSRTAVRFRSAFLRVVCFVVSRGISRSQSTDHLGRGQAVRRGTLDPVFEGSNPSAPANPREAVGD